MDLIIALCGLFMISIVITGGGEIQLHQHTILLYSIKNALTLALILIPIRYLSSRHTPFLLVKKFNLTQLPLKTHTFLESLYRKFQSTNSNEIPTSPQKNETIKWLILILAISTAIKLSNAWFYYGFYSGDDVEIVEMTFSRLFDLKWEAWNLRNAFYPMTFIYPVQALLKSIGVTNPRALVFGGSMVVILFSTLNIILTYRIVSRMLKNNFTGLLAAFFLAFSQLHISFASTVLPRTVATTFILAALLLTVEKPKSNTAAAFAGLMLGISAVIRFSEIIFIIPFMVYLLLQKRIRHAAVMAGSCIITGAALLGISDFLYWGSPFFSLKNIIDYTLVKKLSSRGYQSPLYYFTHFWEWTNLFVIILAAAALKWKNRFVALWAVFPIIILSILPHKEARYLIPVLPFWASLTALGFYSWLERIMESKNLNEAARWKKLTQSSLLLVFIFCASFILEIDGYRSRRSESAVDTARYITHQKGVEKIAIEQTWKAGGILYLHKIPAVLDISTDKINDTAYFSSIVTTEGLQYIILKARSISDFKLEPILAQNGFTPIEIGQQKRDKYCIYISKNNRAKPK